MSLSRPYPSPVMVNDAFLWVTAPWRQVATSAPMSQQRTRRARVVRSSAAIEACIFARENGGDYGRSNNPTHFGAYQFSRSTWAANGGDPASWGSASPAEQDRIFRNTVDAHGYSAWTPYDGC